MISCLENPLILPKLIKSGGRSFVVGVAAMVGVFLGNQVKDEKPEMHA
jgi:hypothetical protein